MARPRGGDARYDFRGGLNTTFTEDVLDPTELRRIKNGRLATYGGITKRLGSTRAHATVIEAGAKIIGLHGAFDSIGGRKMVALSNAHIFWKLIASADYTKIVWNNGQVNTRARMVQYRRGAQMFMYIATGGANLYEWDGAAVPTNIASAPAGCLDVVVYKGRLFVTNGTKTLAWSQRLAGNVFTVPSGGIADVETFDAEPLIGLGKAGGSLLLFKEDSTARYTGASPDDIRIDTDTEGVSADKGAISRMSIVQLPEAVAFMSAEGPYIATASGVEELGLKLEKEIDGLDKALWDNILMAYHKGRHELWLDVPTIGGSGNNNRYVMNLRTKSWTGPWPVAACTTCRFERADGTDTILRGGFDGWVRREDEGPDAKDDRNSDGTGGSNVSLEVDLPELFFNDPSRVHSLAGKKQSVQADLGAAGSLDVLWSSEMGSGQAAAIVSAGAGMKSYPYLIDAKGKRIRVTFREQTAEVVTLAGSLLDVTQGRSRR